jgi:hypothetical protein
MGRRASADGGSGDDSDSSGPMRLLPEEVEARGKEIAELIRRNGEELAQNVETVVDKVTAPGPGPPPGAGTVADAMPHPTPPHPAPTAPPKKVVRGEYGREVSMAAEHVAGNMDKAVSSFIRSFEENYSRFETAIRKRVDWTAAKRRGGGGGGEAGGAWAGRARGGRLGAGLAASSDADSEGSL